MTESTAPINGALVPWFGAKRVLARRIVSALGRHRCYWEPFCGSMAVLLAKPAVTQETVNDLHDDLVNLARVVRDEGTAVALYARLTRTPTAEALFAESRAVVRSAPAPTTADPPSVDRAYHYFVASWQGLNGVAGTAQTNLNFARRYTSRGGAAATRFASAVASVPAWYARLRTVAIYSGCGIALCEKVEDRPGTVVYADPPYLVKGAKYVHDFAAADHQRLAAALTRFEHTRVVVSYYAHPELALLYPGWRVVPVTTTKAMVNSGGRADAGPVKAPEVLLINQEGGDVDP